MHEIVPPPLIAIMNIPSSGGTVGGAGLEEPVTNIASMDEIVRPSLITIMNIPSSGGTVGGAGLEEPVTIIPGMHEKYVDHPTTV